MSSSNPNQTPTPNPSLRTRSRVICRLVIATVASLGCLPVLAAAAPAPPDPWARLSADERSAGRDDLYRQGQVSIDQGRWSEAAALFQRVVDKKGADADAALYWLAYSWSKEGRSTQALEAVDRLVSTYSSSDWVDDARALRVELQRSAERRAGAAANDPESVERARRDAERELARLERELDQATREIERRESRSERDERLRDKELTDEEELQLFALNSLMTQGSDQAAATLEKFLQTKHARKLDDQALFVLSQSRSPRAAETLGKIAAGTLRPDLQLRALEMLGLGGDENSLRRLDEAMRSSKDPAVRLAVLQAYFLAGQGERVRNLARSEADTVVRAKAIEVLGLMSEGAALRELYRSESSLALRAKILDALGLASEIDFLADLARRETDAALRSKAISGIAVFGGERGGTVLAALYREIDDRVTREAILDSFLINGNATLLVEVARQEKDRELRRKALQVLSMMDSDESRAFLLRALED